MRRGKGSRRRPLDTTLEATLGPLNLSGSQPWLRVRITQAALHTEAWAANTNWPGVHLGTGIFFFSQRCTGDFDVQARLTIELSEH